MYHPSKHTVHPNLERAVLRCWQNGVSLIGGTMEGVRQRNQTDEGREKTHSVCGHVPGKQVVRILERPDLPLPIVGVIGYMGGMGKVGSW